MIGEELGTERLVFLFWDKNFEKADDCIYGGVEELFVSICGDTENWISVDDAVELNFEDEE